MSAITRLERPWGLKQGLDILHDPLLNKGTAFTEAERDALGLRGLLPPHVSTQEEQVARVLENVASAPRDTGQVHRPQRRCTTATRRSSSASWPTIPTR